jgi:hypothetical protein
MQFTAMVALSRGVAPPTAHRAQSVSVAQQPNRQDFPQVPKCVNTVAVLIGGSFIDD